jgi:hypothetical protein
VVFQNDAGKDSKTVQLYSSGLRCHTEREIGRTYCVNCHDYGVGVGVSLGVGVGVSLGTAVGVSLGVGVGAVFIGACITNTTCADKLLDPTVMVIVP